MLSKLRYPGKGRSEADLVEWKVRQVRSWRIWESFCCAPVGQDEGLGTLWEQWDLPGDQPSLPGAGEPPPAAKLSSEHSLGAPKSPKKKSVWNS